MSEETEVKVTKAVSKPRSRMPKMGVTSWIALIAVVLAVGAAVYFWQDAQDARNQTPEAIAARNAEESAQVIESLSEVLQLNSDDEPTVARIEDPEVLRQANPDFYRDAELNDYLILYPQRAIIYREAEQKIVNIAPIINTADLQPANNSGDDSTEENN